MNRYKSNVNIVEKYKIENITIKICDDVYKNITPYEFKEILENINERAWDYIRKKETCWKKKVK